jgi:hypothetical protein
MTTKVVRMETDCVEIIRGHTPEGGSITDGVRAMEKLIRVSKESRIDEAKQRFQQGSEVSFSVPDMTDGMPAAYWRRLKKELELFIDRSRV